MCRTSTRNPDSSPFFNLKAHFPPLHICPHLSLFLRSTGSLTHTTATIKYDKSVLKACHVSQRMSQTEKPPPKQGALGLQRESLVKIPRAPWSWGQVVSSGGQSRKPAESDREGGRVYQMPYHAGRPVKKGCSVWLGSLKEPCRLLLRMAWARFGGLDMCSSDFLPQTDGCFPTPRCRCSG